MKQTEKIFNNIKIDEQILDRVNKIEDETLYSHKLDLNRQVEDLLDFSSDCKYLERSRAEFPIQNENFYKEDTYSPEVVKITSPNIDAKGIRLPMKVFEVRRLTKQQRAEVILQSFLSKDSEYYSSNNSSQRYEKRCHNEYKQKEVKLTEHQSDITMDKSNFSYAIQNGVDHEFANCDMIEEIDDLLSGKKVEQDYYSSVNMLNEVALPGLSSDEGGEEDFNCSSNEASGLGFDQEDGAWEAKENNLMFI